MIMEQPPTKPAFGKYPLPDMRKHSLVHYHSDIMDRIALLALQQVMAGMLSTPLAVMLVERNVTSRFTLTKEPVEYRYTFQVQLNEKSTPYTNWLVSIPCNAPDSVTGMVSEVTPIREAKVYEWDDGKGWQEVLTFQHPHMEQDTKDSWYILDRDHNPLDWPPY